jgi:AraC-like DNA-binding protein
MQQRRIRASSSTSRTGPQRARHATNLLLEGVSILDVVSRLGYFDQAHLTRSLRRFIGETPTQIVQRQKQLSFLYKTDLFNGRYNSPLRRRVGPSQASARQSIPRVILEHEKHAPIS